MLPFLILAVAGANPTVPRIATVTIPADEVREEEPRRWLVDEADEGRQTESGTRIRLRGTRVKLKMPLG